ncbi:hypothetical protein HNY73_002733 [Argiope bruennichi]|uniref:Uncharacterized protein n=1 Tax=Argiope bruennichi TaxID=94029 RepID=A0A8T0G0V5_ARGBR|nr:hypothetical protein HNY73_002733 [Argiope bruennichi]
MIIANDQPKQQKIVGQPLAKHRPTERARLGRDRRRSRPDIGHVPRRFAARWSPRLVFDEFADLLLSLATLYQAFRDLFYQWATQY